MFVNETQLTPPPSGSANIAGRDGLTVITSPNSRHLEWMMQSFVWGEHSPISPSPTAPSSPVLHALPVELGPGAQPHVRQQAMHYDSAKTPCLE